MASFSPPQICDALVSETMEHVTVLPGAYHPKVRVGKLHLGNPPSWLAAKGGNHKGLPLDSGLRRNDEEYDGRH